MNLNFKVSILTPSSKKILDPFVQLQQVAFVRFEQKKNVHQIFKSNLEELLSLISLFFFLAHETVRKLQLFCDGKIIFQKYAYHQCLCGVTKFPWYVSWMQSHCSPHLKGAST